jgi:UPF0755 protein
VRGRKRQKALAESRAGRPRRSAATRVLLSLGLLFAITAAGLISLGIAGFNRFVAEGPLEQPKVLVIDRGLGTTDIARTLEEAGVIADQHVFTAAAFLTGSRGRLKAGEYEFPAHASIRDVMNKIASGEAILHKVTIPEGWTTEMALNRVRENDVLTGDLTVTPKEGEILPATYSFTRGKTRDELVADMMQAQKKLLDELWMNRDPNSPVKTPLEAVTLASIVEKETAVAEERAEVAAVFINRLRKNMRLQSDPTIIYGIAGSKGKLDRPLSKADIASKTPYNTYQIDGLPPGPIANPGRASIEAVLDPATSKALYFVADGTGGHVFAETLAEHNANVKKWRGIERNRLMVEAQDEAAASQPDAQASAESQTPDPGEPAALPDPQSQMPDIESVATTSQNGEAPEEPALPAAAADQSADGSGPDPEPAATPPSSDPAATATAGQQKPVMAAAAPPVRKPGELIQVANRLVPIPVPKPRRP